MFTERRHELLASNIANLDTPDYRARDLSVDRFQNALADSIENTKRPSPGARDYEANVGVMEITKDLSRDTLTILA